MSEEQNDKQLELQLVKTEIKKPEIVLENIEDENGNRKIENGFKMIKQIRKEAERQRDVKVAKNLVEQSKPMEQIPLSASEQEIGRLADEMEIFEED